MAAGFLSQGVCWGLLQEAQDAHYQSIPPFVLPSSTNSIFHFYIKQTNGSWNTVKQTISNTGASTINFNVPATAPRFTTCVTPNDPTTSFLSGIELGWHVSGVLIVAYCIMRLRRGF